MFKSYMTVELINKPCAFVIRMEMPLVTLQRIIELLYDRKIKMETMQVHSLDTGDAILIMHCQVERDRIKHTQQCLEKMKGVLQLELLESKGSNVVKL
jgi:acetolactate synthase small subunit